MTTIWQFLVLPGVLQLLQNCDGMLCRMLKDIATQKGDSTEEFNKCGELLYLLGYSSNVVAGLDGHYGLSTTARLQLALSEESAEIGNRFKAHTEVTRFCIGDDLQDGSQKSVNLSAPFVILQKLNYDYLIDDADLFTQAATQSGDRAVREQHTAVGIWLRDIFAIEQFRKAAGLGPEHQDFFACEEGKNLSLSFRFLHMSSTATHAVFLMQPVPASTVIAQEMLKKDPDTPGYPGQVSLGRNRAVWYESRDGNARDGRLWELRSAFLLTWVEPDELYMNGTSPTPHAFPQWYPHGAASSPPNQPICKTFDRRVEQKLEAIDSIERCNRDASAQVMSFVAASRTKPSDADLAAINMEIFVCPV